MSRPPGKKQSGRIDSGFRGGANDGADRASPLSVVSPAMSYQTLLLETRDRIATITINRPDKLNALNDQTIGELGRAIDEVERNGAVGGVIVTGAGRAFVAGADIAEMADQTPVDARARARLGQNLCRRIETLPKPVIAAVNGFALGGGCELAMACHVRIASESAQFGQPEVKLGITPGFGGTQRLARLVGRGRALHLLLTGERIDAREAHRIGLVNAVVPPADLVTAATALMSQMLANAPLAIALCLEAVDRGLDMSVEEGCALEANHFGLLAATADMREGMRAFLDKRPAQFRGA
jgi:enoyl-CoA hydratase